MKTLIRFAYGAALLAAFHASAQVSPVQEPPMCPRGQALTYTLQCDAGTRTGGDRIWNPQGAGVEVCRATEPRCEDVRAFNKQARPGFEVQDSAGGSLSVVSFGVARLMGADTQ